MIILEVGLVLTVGLLSLRVYKKYKRSLTTTQEDLVDIMNYLKADYRSYNQALREIDPLKFESHNAFVEAYKGIIKKFRLKGTK